MDGHRTRVQRVRRPGEIHHDPPRQPLPQRRARVAALAASCSKRTYLSVKHKRIASHRGPMKALVAVEHAMLVAA